MNNKQFYYAHFKLYLILVICTQNTVALLFKGTATEPNFLQHITVTKNKDLDGYYDNAAERDYDNAAERDYDYNDTYEYDQLDEKHFVQSQQYGEEEDDPAYKMLKMDPIPSKKKLKMLNTLIIKGAAESRYHMKYNCEHCWEKINNRLHESFKKLAIANWNYEMNMTHDSADRFAAETERRLNITREIMQHLLPRCRPANWIHRRMDFLLTTNYRYGALDESAIEKLIDLQTKLKWLSYRLRNCTITDDAKTTYCRDIMYELPPKLDGRTLHKYYTMWRLGAHHREPIRIFTEYVGEIIKLAKFNNLTHPNKLFLRQYERDSFWEDMVYLVTKMTPIYNELFCYVRRQLRFVYSEDVFKKGGMMPSYVIDHPWSENWIHLFPMLVSEEYKIYQNFTQMLENKSLTVERTVKIAEKALMKIGFEELSTCFWNKSVFREPKNRSYRNYTCDPEIWDMHDGESFRIKECGGKTKDDFITAHRLVVGIHYLRQYRNLPFLFQSPPVQGFMEGIQTVIELSVCSPSYMARTIGYQPKGVNETFGLLEVALRKIPFLFHGMAADQWRWLVLDKSIEPKSYNKQWWKLRNDIEGVSHLPFTSGSHFDVSMKYRDMVMEPYIGHVFGVIFGFQLYREICIATRQYSPKTLHMIPLHRCNLFESPVAGVMLRKGMMLGSAKPWYLVMEEMINDQDLRMDGMVEYFLPLYSWLQMLNCKINEYHSWRPASFMHKKGRGGRKKTSVTPSPTTPRRIVDDEDYNEEEQHKKRTPKPTTS